MIKIEKSDPLSAESLFLVEKLSAELAEITGDNGKSHFKPEEMQSDRSVWALARDENGEAVGCGAIRPISNYIAELKRMFSVRKVPGIGSALVNFLEIEAKYLGYCEIRLETRRINKRAVTFYQKHGYTQIENYGPYVGRDEAICFSKRLNLD